MTTPTVHKVQIMKTVLGAQNQKMCVGEGTFYYRAKCPAVHCKGYGINEGQNESGIVMRCKRCSELFLALEPGAVEG